MAKKTAQGRVGSLLSAAGSQDKGGAHGVTRPTIKPPKPSALLDTRGVYCGDNLEQLAKLPDAYIDYMRPHCVELGRVFKKTGSLCYHCDWHASHYVKVMLDQILGENNFTN